MQSMNKTVQTFESGHVRIVSARYEEESDYMPVQYPVSSSALKPEGISWKEISSAVFNGIPGIRAVMPRITTMATLQESTIKHAILWGVYIEKETELNNWNYANRDNGLIEGRYPDSGANECAVGTLFAQKTGLSVGDKIPLKTISAHFSDKLWSPVITGIFNFDYRKYDENVIITDFERLERLLNLGEGTQQLIIYADDENHSQAIASMVQDILGEDNYINDWKNNIWIVIQKSNDVIYMAAYLIFLIVASFLIINTIAMIIHERIKEIGMMGCLGMSRSEIVKVFFFESLFLASIGASCGVFLGGVLTGILSRFPVRLGDLYGNTINEIPVSTTVFFMFSFKRLLMSWFAGVFIASIFTLIPVLKSAFVEPVEALRK